MSDYKARAFHPVKGVFEEAEYLDDYYGPHRYAVRFADERVFPIEECDKAAAHLHVATNPVDTGIAVNNGPKLSSITWTQEPHCCAMRGIEPVLTVRVEDGGAGEYLVIEASEWAIDMQPGESVEQALARIGGLLG